jgi:glutamate synthase (NADPH/NADH) small chain
MGEVFGFLKNNRVEVEYRDKAERLKDYKEVRIIRSAEELKNQGSRCMDCGTPFCHLLGCPLGNLIPEWNDAIYKKQYREAFDRLDMTCSFPEVTGRICPAPCETSCTLAFNDAPVAINQIELAIIEKAWTEGWVTPKIPVRETGKSVAVIGSGPAGMAAAQDLRRRGHKVVLFEKSQKIGGLLRYGIPDFKLDKYVLDRRIEQMKAEGLQFETGVSVGEDLSINYLRQKYDAVLLAMGAGQPRDLPVPGRDLKGVHYALEYLFQSNKNVSGEKFKEETINARGKTVLVIGGGDTGADCVGTANRQGAKKVFQYEIMPKPQDWKDDRNPNWPDWPQILRTSSSHKEGCDRDWSISTLNFEGNGGNVVRGNFERVQWGKDESGRFGMKPIPGSGFALDVDLVLLAMGFVHVEHGRLVQELGLALDPRGNIQIDNGYRTSVPGVYSAGDAHSGASLVVRAMAHGKNAAQVIDSEL